MNPRFFIKEATRALGRNSAPSLAAAATVLITTLVLGVFIPVVQSATGKTNQVRNKVGIEVFIADEASKAEVTELGTTLRRAPHVKSATYVSKAEALRVLKNRLKDDAITKDVPGNPLPASYRLALDDPGRVAAVRNSLYTLGPDGNREPVSPAISDVRDRKDETEKILSATSTIKLLMGGLAILLVLSSVLLVANTIRLSIFARRREVEVMKLVGATNWFIRWPFVIEGVIVGALGGFAAVLLLFIAKKTVIDPLSDSFALIAAPNTIGFPLLVLVLLGAAMLVSALGSGLTLRRFLKV